jgi:hypothetical protein
MINFKTFKSTVVNGGIQYKAFFDNGYGVSIVKHAFSYGSKLGLWELAVLKGTANNYSLCYDTPITGDVIGHLEKDEVNKIVNDIKQLPNV